MPHCIIEYSQGLENEINPSVLIEKVYKGAFESKLFNDTDIKTRAIPFKYHQTGENKINFIHITAKILSGRTDVQKKILSKSIFNQFIDMNLKPLSLTIEVSEIENSSYSKMVL